MQLLLDADSIITELLIGWWAWGAKSATGCIWLCYMCCEYPGTRWLLWRSELKALKITTYNTFLDVARDFFGLRYWVDFRLSNNNIIVFRNGSEIVLMDMKLYPNQDPNFDKLWSTEFTGWFLDEVNQIVFKWYQVASSRIWRYKNDRYGIRGMLLMSCNPAKNRVYKEFYRKKKNGIIEPHKEFIPILARNNPYIAKSYLDKLSRMPPGPMKERLYFGNREYDDTPGILFAYQDIDSFLHKKVPNTALGEKYLVVDVARHGVDRSTCTYREWLQAEILRYEERSDMDKLEARIRQESMVRWVKLHCIIVDEDWVGWWVVDWLWCTGFLNNGRVIENDEITWVVEKPNYQNLRTQCYFKLADMIKRWQIWLTIPPSVWELYQTDLEEYIHDELWAIKEEDMDKDGKRRITDKKGIKEQIGRSPDRADNLMMRMYPLLHKDPDFSRALSKEDDD